MMLGARMAQTESPNATNAAQWEEAEAGGAGEAELRFGLKIAEGMLEILGGTAIACGPMEILAWHISGAETRWTSIAAQRRILMESIPSGGRGWKISWSTICFSRDFPSRTGMSLDTFDGSGIPWPLRRVYPLAVSGGELDGGEGRNGRAGGRYRGGVPAGGPHGFSSKRRGAFAGNGLCFAQAADDTDLHCEKISITEEST